MAVAKMINIGCGSNYHEDWINLDVAPSSPDVMAVDISSGLPFASEFSTACYSSHVLEHLDKTGAQYLIGECFRVLKKDGVIRVVLPDLEGLAREYLRILGTVTADNTIDDLDYDWIMLELFDQLTRNHSGGEMAVFLRNLKEEDRSFVRSRIGLEAESFWNHDQSSTGRSRLDAVVKSFVSGRLLRRVREKLSGWLVYIIAGRHAFRDYQVGLFRGRGEVHQWMYDRYSLKRLLDRAGFVNIEVRAANESRIPDFEKYSLDVVNSKVRKPDSLFVEAIKP
jgi:predicted SAM-dependent methyltransferase